VIASTNSDILVIGKRLVEGKWMLFRDHIESYSAEEADYTRGFLVFFLFKVS